MAALDPPYLYATFEDVRRYCPLQAAHWQRAVAMFSAGQEDIESLIEDTSRAVDAHIAARRPVPLTETPNRSIRKYVAAEVAALIVERFGPLPDGDISEFKARTFAQFKTFLESATNPNAFLDIAVGNDAQAGSSFTAPQTLAYSRSSPFVSDDPYAPGGPYGGSWWP